MLLVLKNITRVQYYFEVLDLAFCGIKDRFDQPGYATYKNLEELLLKGANKLYQDDFNGMELTTQLKLFSTNFAMNLKVTIQDVLDFLYYP